MIKGKCDNCGNERILERLKIDIEGDSIDVCKECKMLIKEEDYLNGD